MTRFWFVWLQGLKKTVIVDGSIEKKLILILPIIIYIQEFEKIWTYMDIDKCIAELRDAKILHER